ncbi:hypothetical protein ACFT54_35405, partial [Streptomyces cinereoruber]
APGPAPPRPHLHPPPYKPRRPPLRPRPRPPPPGLAITGDASGGWARVRTPHTSLRTAVNACNKYAHLTPDLPGLAAFRPAVEPLTHPAKVPAPASAESPATA